ncbi:MAG: cell division protein FtsA [bacterium]|nr:cell division protein FtsA [bacterium]
MEPLFVAWDFEARGVRDYLDAFYRLRDSYELDPMIPSVGGVAPGLIWEESIQANIRSARFFAAFLDLPNVNTAMELGFALSAPGDRRVLQTYRGATRPEWLSSRPFSLYAQERAPDVPFSARDGSGFDRLIIERSAPPPPSGRRGIPNRTILLCPRETGGDRVALVAHAAIDELEIVDSSDLDHAALVHLLRSADSVIWAIPPALDHERDGAANAGMAFIAGYALGLGLDLRVLVPSQGVRPIADVESFRGARHEDLGQFLDFVVQWAEEFRDERRVARVSSTNPDESYSDPASLTNAPLPIAQIRPRRSTSSRRALGTVAAGLDIGTSKICVVAVDGECEGDVASVVGVGTHPSRGLRKGVVVDIEATIESVRAAVEEAELMADCEIREVCVGIAGGHIRAINSRGSAPIRTGEVTERDVQSVFEAAKAVAVPLDREILLALPQEYLVDGESVRGNPVGKLGEGLEVRLHIVSGAVTAATNLVKIANKAGLDVSDIVLDPMASSAAALTENERDLGVCLIDIGGGTADIARFSRGAIEHSAVLGMGGYQMSNDIAVGLRTPFDEAERIKKRFGSASARHVEGEDVIRLASVGGRPPREISRRILCEIIESRVEEILGLCRSEILMDRLQDDLGAGIVLTGGASKLPGIGDFAGKLFEAPVRIGSPCNVGGLTDVVNGPMYSTGVGLALHARSLRPYRPRFPVRGNWSFSRVLDRMRDWYNQEFD